MKKQNQEQKLAVLKLSDVKRPRGAFLVKTGIRAGEMDIVEKKQKNPG